jgi:hypothetical protein
MPKTKHDPRKFLELFQIDGRKNISDVRIDLFFSSSQVYKRISGTKYYYLKKYQYKHQ